jgi:hypothetical protein
MIVVHFLWGGPEAGRAAIDALDRRLRPVAQADRVSEAVGSIHSSSQSTSAGYSMGADKECERLAG